MTINETNDLIVELLIEFDNNIKRANDLFDEGNLHAGLQSGTVAKVMSSFAMALKRWNSQRVQSAASEASGGIKSNVD